MSTQVDAATLRRLRWRCRRGLLENDLFIERYFARRANGLTPAEVQALLALMELPDNQLLDLFLRRAEPDAPLNTEPVRAVLQQIRSAPVPTTTRTRS